MSKYIPIIFVLITHFNLKGQVLLLDLGPDTSYCTNGSEVITSNLIDNTYAYLWSTGDSTNFIDVDTSGAYRLQITYDTLRMNDTIRDTIILIDTINLIFNSVPIPNFSTIPYCYNNPSLIINNSMSDTNSIVTYIIGMDTQQSSADTFAYSGLQNGDSSIVFALINQPNGCSAGDTFIISSLLKPNIELVTDSTCKNVSPLVNNHSTNTTPSYIVTVTEGSTYIFSEATSYVLPPQMAGPHIFNCILSNSNDCSDTMDLPLYIFDILPREIIGLEIEYCVGDPTDTIHGNFPGGTFFGPYITNLTLGQAQFKPMTVDSNIEIRYTYTDSNSCTLSTSRVVEHIFPLPQLNLEGLAERYCHFDPSSIILITPPGGMLTGDELTDITESSAVFTPIMLGLNELQYTYTDIHGCSDTISDSTLVNPLPNVELGPSDTLIASGGTLILGPEFIETNVDYSWSTGDSSNNIVVTNPGYYVLYGINSITNCTSSDTIHVELINKTNDYLPYDIKIFPNPFLTELFIESKMAINAIKIYDSIGKQMDFEIQSRGEVTRLIIDAKGSNIIFLQLNNHITIPILQVTSE